MAWHRKIDVRMWGDSKFRALASPQPCGQWLWVYLMTGPHSTSLPGLSVVGEAGLAESLGWTVKAFREAFREVSSKGMAKADWGARVLWLPKAIIYNMPENPNVVKSWRNLWDCVPECSLKVDAYSAYQEALKHKEAFLKAFREALPKPYPGVELTTVKSALPNQEQEQEQEQEQLTPLTPQGEVLPVNLQTDEFRKAWASWLQHRKEKRAALKPTSAASQLKTFSEWGPERAIRAIEFTIFKGWQGIREPDGAAVQNGRGFFSGIQEFVQGGES